MAAPSKRSRREMRFRAHKTSGEVEIALVDPGAVEIGSIIYTYDEAEDFAVQLVEALIQVNAHRKPRLIIPQPAGVQ